MRSRLLAVLSLLSMTILALALAISTFKKKDSAHLRVLAYSSFVDSWGPGPELVELYKKQMGVSVELFDGGGAGLLLAKSQASDFDIVLGFDQALIAVAAQEKKWKSLQESFSQHDLSKDKKFAIFDWSPIHFVYRPSEITPPRSLNDLLDVRFSKKIAFPDPRSNSTSLQWLQWLVLKMGIKPTQDYLRKLRPNILASPDSWSVAYGLFTHKSAQMALAYLCSPLYHLLIEHKTDYAVARLAEGAPLQFEMSGIPDTCAHCEAALQFLQWLLTPEAQKIIMQKNYMLPIRSEAAAGTAFEALEKASSYLRGQPQALDTELRDKIIEAWMTSQ